MAARYPTCALPRSQRMLVMALALLAILALGRPAAAQVWNESGDAGDLPASAQVTAGNGPLTTINGNLQSPTDVDMYCIHVTDPTQFSACLQCVVIQGPNLWIFDANGNGVAATTTCQAGCKLITNALVTAFATYYVAVAYDAIYPNSAGGPMWNTSPSGGPVISSQMLDSVKGNVTTTTSRSRATRATPER